jgi:hypothetical protein
MFIELRLDSIFQEPQLLNQTCQNTGWATFWATFLGHWAIFMQKHPVALFLNRPKMWLNFGLESLHFNNSPDSR